MWQGRGEGEEEGFGKDRNGRMVCREDMWCEKWREKIGGRERRSKSETERVREGEGRGGRKGERGGIESEGHEVLYMYKQHNGEKTLLKISLVYNTKS